MVYRSITIFQLNNLFLHLLFVKKCCEFVETGGRCVAVCIVVVLISKKEFLIFRKAIIKQV